MPNDKKPIAIPKPTKDVAPQHVEMVLVQFFACVETLLKKIAKGRDGELEQCAQRFELLFGAKSSPADSIVKIVELYLRLKELRDIDGCDADIATKLPISEADAALLDSFIKKDAALSLCGCITGCHQFYDMICRALLENVAIRSTQRTVIWRTGILI